PSLYCPASSRTAIPHPRTRPGRNPAGPTRPRDDRGHRHGGHLPRRQRDRRQGRRRRRNGPARQERLRSGGDGHPRYPGLRRGSRHRRPRGRRPRGRGPVHRPVEGVSQPDRRARRHPVVRARGRDVRGGACLMPAFIYLKKVLDGEERVIKQPESALSTWLPRGWEPRRQRRLRLLDDALLAVQHLLQVDEGGHQARTTANVTSSCADHWMSASPSVGLRYTFDRPMNRSSPAGTATSRSAMARPSTEPGVTRVTVTSASEPFLTCRTVPSTAATLSPVSLAAW